MVERGVKSSRQMGQVGWTYEFEDVALGRMVGVGVGGGDRWRSRGDADLGTSSCCGSAGSGGSVDDGSRATLSGEGVSVSDPFMGKSDRAVTWSFGRSRRSFSEGL